MHRSTAVVEAYSIYSTQCTTPLRIPQPPLRIFDIRTRNISSVHQREVSPNPNRYNTNKTASPYHTTIASLVHNPDHWRDPVKQNIAHLYLISLWNIDMARTGSTEENQTDILVDGNGIEEAEVSCKSFLYRSHVQVEHLNINFYSHQCCFHSLSDPYGDS